jgi:hypothetical protein
MKLITWVGIFHGNVVVPHLSRCFLRCKKGERSWQYSEAPTIGAYSDREESRPYGPPLLQCLYFSPFIHAHFICLDLIKLIYLFISGAGCVASSHTAWIPTRGWPTDAPTAGCLCKALNHCWLRNKNYPQLICCWFVDCLLRDIWMTWKS